MVRYLFYTIGDLTYQSPLVNLNRIKESPQECIYLFGCVDYLHYIELAQNIVYPSDMNKIQFKD